MMESTVQKIEKWQESYFYCLNKKSRPEKNKYYYLSFFLLYTLSHMYTKKKIYIWYNTWIYIYIYIYIERERERHRHRCITNNVRM